MEDREHHGYSLAPTDSPPIAGREAHKSAYQFHILSPSTIILPTKESEGPVYYPDGKQAFVILRFQTYNAYPNATYIPERVAGLQEHFRTLDSLYLDHVLNASSAVAGGTNASSTVAGGTNTTLTAATLTATTTVTTQPVANSAKKELLNSNDHDLTVLFNLEGKKMFTDLHTPTDAGDLSLYDAADLMDEFARRATLLATTNGQFLRTLKQSFYLNADAGQSYQNPLPAPTPPVIAPPVITSP